MKKIIATLIVVAGLLVGSVSFAGGSQNKGGYRTETLCPQFSTAFETCVVDIYSQQN